MFMSYDKKKKLKTKIKLTAKWASLPIDELLRSAFQKHRKKYTGVRRFFRR
jgi:predicted site-specific integrase-resolvase